jgi:NAD(P)-dependent dehydrogenase (short-subunit alcohol dehydrogenase family)
MRDASRSGALLRAASAAGVAERIQVRQLDVTDPVSVESCIKGVVAEHGRLDAVVNNAGAGHLGTLELESLDDIRAVMEVNFFGVLHVTRSSLPHLRASQGRVVTVSSIGGLIGQPFNEAYCAAKFAVEGYMESLAPVAGACGVGVTLIEPGPVATEFVANLTSGEITADGGPYAPIFAAYLQSAQAAFSDAPQTPAQACTAIIEALTCQQPALRVQTSSAVSRMAAAKLADLDGSAVIGMTRGWLA